MGPSKKAAILGAVLVALVLLVILAGIIVGTTGMFTGGSAAEPGPANGWTTPAAIAATVR